jgi:hypothetical protein
VLEKLQQIFSPFKLPIDVTLKTVGCDGADNAWYQRPTMTICYEYLARTKARKQIGGKLRPRTRFRQTS